ncbi:hypothetical protein SLA2020_284280 [Shorea laevis]
MLTFVCIFIACLAYLMGGLLIVILLVFFPPHVSTDFLVVWAIGFVLWILYAAGFVYMADIWQLASAVTVLENTCGIRAMIKSKALVKGKMGVATIIFLMLYIPGWLIQVAFQMLVVESPLGMVDRVAYGIICLLLSFQVDSLRACDSDGDLSRLQVLPP